MEAGAGDSETCPNNCPKKTGFIVDELDDDDDCLLLDALDYHSNETTKGFDKSSNSVPCDKQSQKMVIETISISESLSNNISDTDQNLQLSEVKVKGTPREAETQMENSSYFDNSDTGQNASSSHCLTSPQISEVMDKVKGSSREAETQIDSSSEVDDSSTPMRFRPNYLWVSDLTKQHWCEQMLLYIFTLPVVMEENPVMTAGSSLHLARELEVHDIVRVESTSREDTWAIKFLNLYSVIQGFLNGLTVAREVPIFGAPFNQDVFLVGVIDELRFDPDSYTFELSELKTRRIRSAPKNSQQRQNRLQMMVYKKLFDDLVKGKVTKECLSQHLRLKLDKPLGDQVIGHLDSKFVTGSDLNDLLDLVLTRIQSLTCISQLRVEYVLQGTNESFCHKTVDYDEVELESMFVHYVGFWQGKRDVEGVDIEDAWKCQSCTFADVCTWREKKAQEHSNRNVKRMCIQKT